MFEISAGPADEVTPSSAAKEFSRSDWIIIIIVIIIIIIIIISACKPWFTLQRLRVFDRAATQGTTYTQYIRNHARTLAHIVHGMYTSSEWHALAFASVRQICTAESPLANSDLAPFLMALPRHLASRICRNRINLSQRKLRFLSHSLLTHGGSSQCHLCQTVGWVASASAPLPGIRPKRHLKIWERPLCLFSRGRLVWSVAEQCSLLAG